MKKTQSFTPYISRNLLIIASTFPRWQNDSVPGFVLDFATSIQQYVQSVMAVTPHYPGARLQEIIAPGIFVKRFRYAYPYRFENVAYGEFKKTKLYPLKITTYAFSEFIVTLLCSLRRRPLIINAHWLIPQGFVAVLVGRLTGSKVVITVHGSDVFTLNGNIMRRIKRFALRHADLVVVNSSATQAICQELWPNGAYPIVPMGVGMEGFAPPSKRIERSTYELLFVGRLVVGKGVRYICQAMAILKKRGIPAHLTVIGDGPEKAALEAYAADLGLGDSVSFAGWVAHDALPAHFHMTDVFVGTSVRQANGWNEGLGTVFIEAAAAALPVISTGVGGIKDVVIDGKTGVLVPEADGSAIADAVEGLYKDPQKAQAMGKAARAFVLSRFAWETTAARYASLIHDLFV